MARQLPTPEQEREWLQGIIQNNALAIHALGQGVRAAAEGRHIPYASLEEAMKYVKLVQDYALGLRDGI